MKTSPKHFFMLVLTALIWGGAFVAQSVGGQQVGPLSFNGARSLIGGLVLLPLIPLLRRLSGEAGRAPGSKKALWQGGLLCGVLLGAASTAQQWALQYASVGKAGFITTLYIVIVPLLGALLFKKRMGGRVWGAVVLALLGLYLLCWNGGGSLGLGDGLLLLCSVLFSIHILVVDHFAPLVDGVQLSCIQFFTAGLLCGVPALLIEKPALTDFSGVWGALLYAGVLSCGVAYTFQVLAQKRVEPTLASLTLSLESVFSVLAGWLVLGQLLTTKELLGCGLVFCAVVLAQLPEKLTLKKA